jgi:hypothetical protein
LVLCFVSGAWKLYQNIRTVNEKGLRVCKVLFFVEAHFNLASQRVDELFVDFLENRSLAEESVCLLVKPKLGFYLLLLACKSHCLRPSIHEPVSKEGNFGLSPRWCQCWLKVKRRKRTEQYHRVVISKYLCELLVVSHLFDRLRTSLQSFLSESIVTSLNPMYPPPQAQALPS